MVHGDVVLCGSTLYYALLSSCDPWPTFPTEVEKVGKGSDSLLGYYH